MIRIILAIALLICSIVSVSFGHHPLVGIVGCIISMMLLAWYCVSKYEGAQFVSLKG